MLTFGLLISSIVAFFILYVFIWGLRSRFGKKYSDNQLLLKSPHKRIEQFPRWYTLLFLLVLLMFFVFFIACLFILPVYLAEVQKLIYYSDKTEIFIAPYMILASLIPSMFVGMVVYSLIYKILLLIFRQFDRYQALMARIYFGMNTQGLSQEEKDELWNDALKKVDLEKLAISEWRTIFIMGILVWIFAGPMYVLAMDTYVRVESDGIVVNPFLKLTEKKYKFSDVEKAVVSTRAYESKKEEGEYKMNPHFELQFKDGYKEDLWGGVGWGSPTADELILLAMALESKDVQIEVDQLDSEEELGVFKQYNDSANSTVGKVFEYFEKK